MELILASNSPRRRDILKLAQLDFKVRPASVDEEKIRQDWAIERHQDPGSLVEQLALAKAEAVFDQEPRSLVLGADTLVVLTQEGKFRLLGKPHSKAEAYEMLRALAGKTHQVYTGVALRGPGIKQVFYAVSEVEFFPLDAFQEELMSHYVESGKAQDKAGAYGIQDEASGLVKGIKGDFFTVMGLPLSLVLRSLYELGYNLPF